VGSAPPTPSSRIASVKIASCSATSIFTTDARACLAALVSASETTLRRTVELAASVPRDTVSASAFWAAAGGLPWVLRERQPLPPSVEASIRLLDEPRRRSAARQYVG
jgi:hypothetical protein